MQQTQMIQVTKRDGQKVDYNPIAIKNAIEWACQGFDDYNPVTLEAKFQDSLRAGITTEEIQQSLIIAANELANASEPNWRYVSGRLKIWSLCKQVYVKRGFGYTNDKNITSDKATSVTDPTVQPEQNSVGAQSTYLKALLWLIDNGYYSPKIWKYYNSREIAEAGQWIVPSRDLDFDYAGANKISTRYLVPNELPQEMFLTLALYLAGPEPESKRMSFARDVYEAISTRKVSLATPILSYLRTSKNSYTSCFVSTMSDSLEGIMREVNNFAKISKEGGGMGINVSHVRARKSSLMGKPGKAKGVIPWVKLLNDVAVAVDQGGQRAGAVTVSLDIWHLDIPEFLEMQTEHGDQRLKAYDVFPQIVVCDEFFRRLEADEQWTLLDPHEVLNEFHVSLPELWGDEFSHVYRFIENNTHRLNCVKKVRAKDLYKQVLGAQLETGLPYVTFKDALNRGNPNKADGYIPGFNLCTESTSNVTPGKYIHCCNLCSLNLAELVNVLEPGTNEEGAYVREQSAKNLEHYARLAVRLLDNTIELTKPPVPEAEAHNERYRTIGVGVMGLADWLAYHNVSYYDRDEISDLFEEIAYHCTNASADLAKERGTFEAYPLSTWAAGKLMNDVDLDWIHKNSSNPEKWVNLVQKIQSYGIRNSQITAIAPNTSSSLVCGCTASILPTLNRFFVDKSQEQVPVAPKFLDTRMWFYETNKHLPQSVVIEAVAEMQKWIDTGISMELVLNLNEGAYEEGKTLNAKDIFDLHVLAWKRGIKAIYYTRSFQKDILDKFEECETCAN